MRESLQSCTVRRKTFASQLSSYSTELPLPDLVKIMRLARRLIESNAECRYLKNLCKTPENKLWTQHKYFFRVRGNASSEPGPALQPAGERALAQPPAGCRAGPGPPCIRNTAYKYYFRVRAMRVVGQGPPCSLLEDPDWGADHFDMGLVCRGDLIPCHQVQGVAISAVASRTVICYFEST